MSGSMRNERLLTPSNIEAVVSIDSRLYCNNIHTYWNCVRFISFYLLFTLFQTSSHSTLRNPQEKKQKQQLMAAAPSGDRSLIDASLGLFLSVNITPLPHHVTAALHMCMCNI